MLGGELSSLSFLALHHKAQHMGQGHAIDQSQPPEQELQEEVESAAVSPNDGEEQKRDGVDDQNRGHVKLL